MSRILKFIVLIVLFLVADLAVAEEQARIMILPFEINGSKELAYLETDLPKILAGELERQGIDVVPQSEVKRLLREQNIQHLDQTIVRDLALLSRADYSLYGTFSQIGTSISLDARLVEAYGLRSPKPLSITKKGMIYILPAVQELAQKVQDELQRKERIAQIKVEGNQVLEADVILTRLNTGNGDLFDAQKLNADLRRLYGLGYFRNITILSSDSPDGKIITFRVEEKPLIQTITVQGAKGIKADDILAVLSSKSGSVINDKVLAEDKAKIRELYRKKGYYNAGVDFKQEQIDPRQSRLNIVVNEGEKLYIRSIRIEGAKQLDEDDLKSDFASSEKGFFSWLTGSGVLKKDMLDHDTSVLEAYYANRGFMDVKVGQPVVDFKKDGIYITFKVEEGRRYKAGNVFFSGDIIGLDGELLQVIRADELQKKGKFFDRSVLRQDIQALSEHYSNFGYAFASADASLKRNEDSIDVTYSLDKGNKVYVRRVSVRGNTKTRDNVARREMLLSDGELFRGSLLRRSRQRLVKLDFFESVEIDTIPFPEANAMDLVVKVRERSTGAITMGAGYSSFEHFFLVGQVQERNLFGKGYSLGLKGSFGGKSSTYNVNFWNPHVYDSDLGLGLETYLKDNDYSDYDKRSFGGALKAGIPVGEYSYLYGRYRLEEYEIKNIAKTASRLIREIEGVHWSSSMYLSFSRDTTDRRINPSKGLSTSLSVEYVGGLLRGDDNFVKYIADSSYYHPLFGQTVLHLHGQAGYVMENGKKDIPLFERFYLGGMNSVRGYENREIAPRDRTAPDKEKIGGNKEFFFNAEYLVPLNQEVGLIGLVFFDAGNTWDDKENADFSFYKSVGAGLRWYSPMGPLRLEYGYPLDELEGKSRKGRFEFSIGQFF